MLIIKTDTVGLSDGGKAFVGRGWGEGECFVGHSNQNTRRADGLHARCSDLKNILYMVYSLTSKGEYVLFACEFLKLLLQTHPLMFGMGEDSFDLVQLLLAFNGIVRRFC